MEPLELYRFRVRDPKSGKWRTTSYRMTFEEARERYGMGNYEPLEWSKETRIGSPDKLSAAHLQGIPRSKAD